MSNITILTEAGRNGWGHLSRCTAIAQAFVAIGSKPKLVVQVDSKSPTVFEFPTEQLDWRSDELVLQSILKQSDLIIIDSYLAKLEIYQAIVARCSAVFIDDYQRLNYPSGTIVNTSLGTKRSHCHSLQSNLVLGPRYHPLKKQFWYTNPISIKPKINSIVLSLGGKDPLEVTGLLIQTIATQYPKILKYVVIGPDFVDSSKIKEMADDYTKIITSASTGEMISLFQKCDLAIVSAGQTLLEVACLALPCIAIVVADNQATQALAWKQAGFCQLLDVRSSLKEIKNITTLISKFTTRESRLLSSQTAQKYITNQGAIKLATKLLQKFSHEIGTNFKLTVGPVCNADNLELFRLANQPSIRSASLTSQKILPLDHNKWLANKLVDKNCFFLVAKYNSQLVGQIRFDRSDASDASPVLSISLDKNYRQMGFGSRLLSSGLQKLTLYWPEAKSVKAFVKIENKPSQKFFSKNNFIMTGMTSQKNVLVLGFMYELSK